ncbi:MAG: hypothetical protein E6G56_10630 [Actinobacteria bacterium]|nr:MAG: hypothetical protein E6G56_10630 [Actinomycetota bacterium]
MLSATYAGVLATAALFLVLAPEACFAQGGPVEARTDRKSTVFEVTPVAASTCGGAFANCVNVVYVAYGNRLVYTSGRDAAPGQRVGEYRWTCSRAGRHLWAATTQQQTPGQPPGPIQKSAGSFDVPGCTPWRPVKGRRSPAVQTAARLWYPRQIVVEASCAPSPRGRQSGSARWTCTVVHDSAARECTTTQVVNFAARTYLGQHQRRAVTRTGRSRCRRRR